MGKNFSVKPPKGGSTNGEKSDGAAESEKQARGTAPSCSAWIPIRLSFGNGIKPHVERAGSEPLQRWRWEISRVFHKATITQTQTVAMARTARRRRLPSARVR
jgi:hypothetical protein